MSLPVMPADALPLDSYVIARVEGGVGRLILNRPDRLNALTFDMTRTLRCTLETWATDPAIIAITLETSSPKAFCAGGDMRAVLESYQHNPQDHLTASAPYFAHEYDLNLYLAQYPKPIVALLQGITMGGGMGLGMHVPYRVVTPTSQLAMPEAALGFFPDVGAGFFFQHCPPGIGLLAGLTGWRFTAAQALWAGLATHHVIVDRLPQLVAALVADPHAVPTVLAQFHEAPPADTVLIPHAPLIGRICGSTDEVEILQDAFNASGGAFGAQVAGLMQKASPTSLKVWSERWRRAEGLSLAMILKQDYTISQNFMAGHDVYEGIRSVLVDKDGSPNWRPNVLEAVTPQDVRAYLTTLPSVPWDVASRS